MEDGGVDGRMLKEENMRVDQGGGGRMGTIDEPSGCVTSLAHHNL
jgi:hypothetical protein